MKTMIACSIISLASVSYVVLSLMMPFMNSSHLDYHSSEILS